MFENPSCGAELIMLKDRHDEANGAAYRALKNTRDIPH